MSIPQYGQGLQNPCPAVAHPIPIPHNFVPTPCPKGYIALMRACGHQQAIAIKCKSPLCPTCERERARKVQTRWTATLSALPSLKLMTLTIANGQHLAEQLQALDTAFRNLLDFRLGKNNRDLILRTVSTKINTLQLAGSITAQQGQEWLESSKKWLEMVRKEETSEGQSFKLRKLLQGLSSLEITYNPEMETWHAHRHLILSMPYMPQIILSELWNMATSGGGKIVDIRAIRDIKSGIVEAIKYTTKPWEIPDRKAEELLKALKGKKRTWAIGRIKPQQEEKVCPACEQPTCRCSRVVMVNRDDETSDGTFAVSDPAHRDKKLTIYRDEKQRLVWSMTPHEPEPEPPPDYEKQEEHYEQMPLAIEQSQPTPPTRSTEQSLSLYCTQYQEKDAPTITPLIIDPCLSIIIKKCYHTSTMETQEATPQTPERTKIQVAEIPAEIRSIPHWVTWQYEPRKDGGKPAKAPYTPYGARADVTRPNTWASFDNVMEAYQRGHRSGIGYVLTQADTTVAIDLDKCVEAGQLNQKAQEITNLLDSYTEISPSGKGLRILVQANMGDFAGRKRGDLELYNYDRYVSITGNRVQTTPPTIEPRLNELRELYKRYLTQDKPSPGATKPHQVEAPKTLADNEVLERMFTGKLGQLYREIYHGNIGQVAGMDESRADTLLLNGLAFYTYADATQMRRIALSSPRAIQRMEKWTKSVSGQLTYLEYQIQDSIAYSRRR